jgi:cellulase/cellobiase CelA1
VLHKSTAIATGIAAALLVPAAPAAAAAPACQVAYSLSDDSTGFTSYLEITNIGDAPLLGWTLKFQLRTGQSLDHGWNANFSETNGAVTGTHLEWNKNVAAKAMITIGFRGNGPGEAGEPTTFTVNELACKVV